MSMAEGEGSSGPEDKTTDKPDESSLPETRASEPISEHDAKQKNATSSEDDDDGTDDEEELDEEPRLKYATLTKSLASLYRNGDATSACLVAGDKMIVGTHDGNIHVLVMPSLQNLKHYRAHQANVSSISISPYPPPLPIFKPDASYRSGLVQVEVAEKSPSNSPNPKQPSRQTSVPKIPSNDIFIASSSIDGNVCIASLIDPQDVQLRNFGRPVQAVALSPNYKSDRLFLSGGQAGNLVRTIGGQKGKSTNASTTGTAAAASSWLGSIGLGTDTGTDKILSSGEGIISNIKWSLSGKYVLWVTEEGVKVMRSHLHLERDEAGLEWKTVNHISRPKRPGWEEMSGVWKARADWIDRSQLEPDDEVDTDLKTKDDPSRQFQSPMKPKSKYEEAIVGWGDTVWLLKVLPGEQKATNAAQQDLIGGVEITASIRFDDCVVSGVSMYTSNLVLVLAHMERKQKKSNKQGNGTKKGRPQRLNGLEPELRIVDILSKEEIDSDTLKVSRFEALTASDYHLCFLPATRTMIPTAAKGYLETIGGGMTTVGSGLVSGVEMMGQGMYDATLYGPRKLGVNRFFSGSDSIRSGRTGTEGSPSVKGGNYLTSWIPGFGTSTITNEDVAAVATSQGAKIFMFSPYDCIVGIRRNLADRLQWLVGEQEYREAWELLDKHPEAAGPSTDSTESSAPETPSKASSKAQSSSATGQLSSIVRPKDTLAEFFADSFSVSSSQRPKDGQFSKATKEKRRIGWLWVQQLLDSQKWSEAGEVAGKVVDNAAHWDDLFWKFERNNRFDEISPYIPTFQITPTLRPMVYEVVLGHYVSVNRRRFKELIDEWPSDLFEISNVTSAIETELAKKSTVADTDDWRVLQESLAKLSLANGNYKEALKCYISLHDADTALTLIKEHHLVDAITDDIASFVLIRIPSSEIKHTSRQELEELSSDSVRLLVDEATHGVVEMDDIVTQLQSASLEVFLYFYLRALWRGEGATTYDKKKHARGRAAAEASLVVDEGKLLVEQYADTAVELFAEYDRDALIDFLHGSTAYTFEKAVKICERRHLIEELVYLLSKTGALKKALFLIIDELNDVSKAIDFAKEQDDAGLWNDFLDYSMSRPHFISGLLAEVGTAIDPIQLVKRIPSGLEIEGLKDGLQKMMREYDIQDSISSGVANVLSSEVGIAMETLRRGRRQGIKFEVPERASINQNNPQDSNGVEVETDGEGKSTATPGRCATCHEAFTTDEKETLVGFACGHVYHVGHLLNEPGHEDEHELGLPNLKKDTDDDDDEGYSSGFIRSIGPKVTNARLLRDKIEDIGGCRVCRKHRMEAV